MTDDSLLPKSRVCSKCREEKLLGEFYKSKGGKYGRKSRCKVCHNQYSQEYKERYPEYQKQYCEANKEKRAEYGKQYREANPEYAKQYYQNNKEHINELERTHRKNNEQFRIKKNLSRNLRKALNKIVKTKNNRTMTYIGCSIEYLREHLNSTKEPDWGDDLHIDHTIPKSLFDHTNEEEIKKCWNWRNLRYLPAEENMNKHDTLDMDLVKSYGIEDLLPEGVDK
tara:strand:+ start:488 stop:1162 length:675 start_codon:yes stop_codon:yes gene_type:complete